MTRRLPFVISRSEIRPIPSWKSTKNSEPQLLLSPSLFFLLSEFANRRRMTSSRSTTSIMKIVLALFVSHAESVSCLPLLFLFCRERNPWVHCSHSKVQSTRYSARQKRTSRSRMRKQFLLFLSFSLFVFFDKESTPNRMKKKTKRERKCVAFFRSMMKKKKKKEKSNERRSLFSLLSLSCVRSLEITDFSLSS